MAKSKEDEINRNPNDYPPMNNEQYRAICTNINQNDEDNKRTIKKVEFVIGEKIDLHMDYINKSIGRMDKTIREHNGRLRDVEKEEIRRQERELAIKNYLKDLNEKLEKDRKDLKKQVDDQENVCKVHMLNLSKLKQLDKMLGQIYNRPVKTILIVIMSVLILDLFYHLITYGLNEFGGVLKMLWEMFQQWVG